MSATCNVMSKLWLCPFVLRYVLNLHFHSLSCMLFPRDVCCHRDLCCPAMAQSITTGVLIQLDARTVPGFSHVKFNCIDDSEAELILLCGVDVFEATVPLGPCKQAFLSSVGRGMDVGISTTLEKSSILSLTSRDTPGNTCTVGLKGLHGEVKDTALQLFRQRVPMMGLHEHPQRPAEESVEGMMAALQTLAASASVHQATLRMCSKLMHCRARENSALQARLENWGGMTNTSPAGSQGRSRDADGLNSTQSSGPEASPARSGDDAVQASTPELHRKDNFQPLAGVVQEPVKDEPVGTEDVPSQMPAPSPAMTKGASPSVRSRFASRGRKRGGAAVGSTVLRASARDHGAGTAVGLKPSGADDSTPASTPLTGARAAHSAALVPAAPAPPATQQGGMAATTAPPARAVSTANAAQEDDGLMCVDPDSTSQPQPTAQTADPATSSKPSRSRKRRKPVDEAFA